MKILIIGNGFDLAHYLPTAYAHFMGVMQAIEHLPDGKEDITFDDLFSGLASLQRNKEFFAKTREIYDGDNLRFDVDKIYELKGKLQENKWYGFFKKHMEINTWIDFENKIHAVLMTVFKLYSIFSDIKNNNGRIRKYVFNYKVDSTDGSARLFLNLSDSDILILFGFLVKVEGGGHCEVHDAYRLIDDDFIYDLKISDFIDFLHAQLVKFSGFFNCYLSLICSSFSKKIFNLDVNSGVFDGLDVSRVYSFNYTSTLLNLYSGRLTGDGSINFLHGSVAKGSIVLGVDSLDEDFLNDFNLHGFLKYHQKLFFDTDYLFLEQDESIQAHIKDDGNKLQIYVWGHSMDSSDGDYIRELFSFTDGKVMLVVFYFGSAKFELLAKLLKIVGREKIEKWMKKGWLKFEQAPDLYELNFGSKKSETLSIF
jgi:hypothetical protein